MQRLLIITLLLVLPLAARDPLAQRIVKTDPAAYRPLRNIHGGAGTLQFESLLGYEPFNTNVGFVHRGVLEPKSGIGHHVHSHMEEMFIILDNEAQFTINGRTSRLEAPAMAPCRMGSSHAIYNPTDRPTQWMNIAVFTRRGKYDTFDLKDGRVGVPLDKIPVFINARFDKSLLKPQENFQGGKGTTQYRRVLEPFVFYTNWSYVDHLVLPPGAATGKKDHRAVEEFYYVLNGSGTVHVNDETAPIEKDQGVPVLLGDGSSFENTGNTDLELMVIGVAMEKWQLDED